jgi:glycosyltransferase involved in cell wall biosynthesis
MSSSLRNDILVVIPAKNESKYITSCLEAVQFQDYPSFEIVVVDNGSTDTTMNIVAGFPGVTLLEKEGGTISSVRNFGSKYASSEYIAFLDGDCVPPASWLQTGVELLQDERISSVGFPASSPDSAESWVVTTWHMMSSSAKHETSCYVDWLSSFNLIMKRVAFEEVGGFDESLETCEDFDLGMKLSKHSRLLFNDTLTVQHLGVVSSLQEFFRKELWRGKSNLQQLKRNKEGMKGIIGVIVPFFYVISILFLCILSFWSPKFFLLLLVVLISLPFAFACRRLKEMEQVRFLPKMLLLASVYLFARGLAVIWK